MKMSTLRNRSKPLMFGLAFIFIFFMTGLFQLVISDETQNTNNNYIASSDKETFLNITEEQYFDRYERSKDFWHQRANPFGPDSPYSAIDKQLDTINAKMQVWAPMINDRIYKDFIQDLELIPPTDLDNYKNWDQIRVFVKNYPTNNPTFKQELEALRLYDAATDTFYTFSQELYEKAVDDLSIETDMDKAWKIYNIELYDLMYAVRDADGNFSIKNGEKTYRGSRWTDWFSTMLNNIAEQKFRHIINSTLSMSSLELKDQMILEKEVFDFDYLTLSMKDIEVEVTDKEIEEYYNSIKDDPSYNLKANPKKVVEFVKWDIITLNEIKTNYLEINPDFETDLITLGLYIDKNSNVNQTLYKQAVTKETLEQDYKDAYSGNETNVNSWDDWVEEMMIYQDEERESAEELAGDFEEKAKKGWNNAIDNDDTHSLHLEIELSNEFSMSESGLGEQVTDSDDVKKPLYNVIGAGRKIIEFAFKNDVGTIKQISIDSDRSNGTGFNDIGVFYIKEKISNKYLSLDESGKKNQLRNELEYKQRNEIAKKIFEETLNQYSSEEFESSDFDLLAYLAENDENLLIMNHNGTINNFVNSLINTNLRNSLMNSDELKGFMISLDEGFNYTIIPIDNENVAVFKINSKPDTENLLVEDYKKTEQTRLQNTQMTLFLEDQKESANITDNRKNSIF